MLFSHVRTNAIIKKSVTILIVSMMFASALSPLGLPTEAFASISTTDIDVNGGNSVTVAPNATVTVTVTVSLSSDDSWRGTEYRFDSGNYTCVDTADHTDTNPSGSQTFTESFTITAPSSDGTYDLGIRVREDAGCTGTSNSSSLNNAITVATPSTTNIDSVTFNGNSTATVAPGASVAIVVTTTIAGNNDWESTSWNINGDGQGTACVNTSDQTTAGTYTASFNITAPNTAGTYDIEFGAHGTGGSGDDDSCSTSADDSISLNDVITVASPDTTSPVISGTPSDMIVEATSASGANVTYTNPTATDANPANPVVTCSPASSTTFAIGDTTVNCSASDTAGNSASTSFVVSVVDTTAPTMAQHADITAEATGSGGASVNFTVNADDIVDGILAAVCAPASGSLFALGANLVNCNKTDAHNNVATQMTFGVTVVDTTSPVITLIGSPTVGLLVGDSYSDAGATASDAVDGSPTVTTSGSVDTAHWGTYTLTYTVSDTAGNPALPVIRTITVSDVTGPVISGAANIILEALNASGANANYNVTASDNSDGANVPVSCGPIASGNMFPLGITHISCTAQDTAGNSSAAAFTVTVEDTTAPSMSNMPSDITAEATSALGAVVTYVDPTGSDDVDASVSISCVPASGSQFALGTTPVTCTATDDASNTSSQNFNVTVVDTTAPVITLNGSDVSISAGDSYSDAGATANDIVDGSVVVVVGGSVDTGNAGSYTITYNATDSAGNAATEVTRTVTVQSHGNGPTAGAPIWMPTPGVVLGMTTSGVDSGGSTGEETVAETSAEAAPACKAILTAYIGRGKNDPEAVKILQAFLNGEMPATLEVNGIYNAATIDVVKAFQLKYATEVLAPWGITEATGIVYKTTQRMINKIGCPDMDIPMPELN